MGEGGGGLWRELCSLSLSHSLYCNDIDLFEAVC